MFHEDSGVHGVYVGTTPETAPPPAVEAINEEMEKLGRARSERRDLTLAKAS